MNKMMAWFLALVTALSFLADGASCSSASDTNNVPPKTAEACDNYCNDDDDLNLDHCKHCDYVHSLPGYDDDKLPSPWYSGYLDYELEGRTIHTHYILVVAEGENENEKASATTKDKDNNKPLIYWSNGGPGASSMFGLLTELGPLLLSDLSYKKKKTGGSSNTNSFPITPIYNPYSWTKLGHVLMFDQPAPVGFSYCNEDVNLTSCAGLSWTDELASENSFRALQAFYKKFPEYNKTDLYLTGESYGGIYIPTLARRILQDHDDKEKKSDSSFIRKLLKGFAVGDGCLGTETGICSDLKALGFDIWGVLFLAGHGQIPLSTLREVMKACKHSLVLDDDDNDNNNAKKENGVEEEGSKSDAACDAALKKVKDEAGSFFEYSLYDDCTYRNMMMTTTQRKEVGLGGAVNDYPCGGYPTMVEYLSMPEVKKALHVEKSNYFSVDNANGFDYTPTEKDLTSFYQDVQGTLKILIYNGDSDPAITSFAAQNWTSHLGIHKLEDWRPWTIDSCRRTGGYVTRYKGSFDYVTIRGAGHMVPTYKPEATYTFMDAWINGHDYPTYDKDCEHPPPIVPPTTTTAASSRKQDESIAAQQRK